MNGAVAQDWQWKNVFGGQGNPNSGNAVATDDSDNIYVTGRFNGTITLGSFSLTANGTNQGTVDMFVAKFDKAGNCLWAKKGTGAGSISGRDIALDTNGNVYVIGSADGGATFDTLITSPGAIVSVFIVKYDNSGNAVWAKGYGTGNYYSGKAISVDDQGNVYATGYFESSFDMGCDPLSATFGKDIFFAKLNSEGDCQWVRHGDSGGNEDVGLAITHDNSGNSYATGYFKGGAMTIDTFNLTGSGFRNPFVVKFDQDGTTQWAVAPDGDVSDASEFGIVNDGSDTYISGPIGGQLIFGNDTVNTNGFNGHYLAKYDQNGNVVWGKTIKGGAFYGSDLVRDNAGSGRRPSLLVIL